MENPFTIYSLVSNSTKKLEPKDLMGEDVHGLVGLFGPTFILRFNYSAHQEILRGLNRGIQ